VEKSVIIIGAGIAGLAAGCYAQMNGYRSQIFELHSLPGGLCTSWVRKGYTFDGCIHYLFGSGEGQPFNQLWHELGVLPGPGMVNHGELLRVSGPDGKTLVVFSDPDRLEAHLCELSPTDRGLIHDFCEGVRVFTRFDMTLINRKPRRLMTLQDWRAFGTGMTPFLPQVAKWALVSAQDFANRFRDPFLRRAIPLMFAWPEIPMMAGLSLLAYMHTGNAGFPLGGSLAFARLLEQRYRSLGGQIHYQSQVEKILVEDGKAVGVRLYNDQVHRADVIISAADGRGTLFYMLGKQYLPKNVRQFYDGRLPVHTLIQVSLGVRRDFSPEPHWVIRLLDQPLLLAHEEHRDIGIKHYCFDPSLAPQGKSTLISTIRTNYDFWQRIYGHRLYDTEQDQAAALMIDFLESVYPGLKQEVEVIDVATPLSYERYTGNWQGSSCGWLLTKESMPLLMTGMEKTVPGVQNFYLAGQWVEPGGSVPLAAMSGRNVLQLVCAADRRPFVSHN
jgi:phytoene dehydrogenase-like protein